MPLWKLRRAEAHNIIFLCFRAVGVHRGHERTPSPTRGRLSIPRVYCSARTANYTTQVRENVPLRKQLKGEAKTKRSVEADRAPKSATEDEKLKDWELTIGIEIHAQLNTARKLFSHAATSVDADPNTHVAFFDIATPGSLPIFQRAALIPAIRAAIALGCAIQCTSRFDRKHYFYHDQPAGYQLTQYYEPFAKDGEITLTRDDGTNPEDGESVTIGIKQIQMEQDTAKSQQSDAITSLIDFNRAGQALIEIISLPQIHSPETAAAYVRKIQAILLSVNSVTTGMEMGGLRADVNVSVRRHDGPSGSSQYSGINGLGQRTEIKNLSTFKGVEEAIKAERDRQINVLEKGGMIEGETRGWSLASPNVTHRLRGKEGEVDYRYMPDPDIAPIIIGTDLINHLRRTLPKLPDELLRMLTNDQRYRLSMTDAKILLQLDDGERLEYYCSVLEELNSICRQLEPSTELGPTGQIAANWVMHELGSVLTSTEKQWNHDLVPPDKLAQILAAVITRKITGSSAKQVLKQSVVGDGRDVDTIIKEDGLVFRPLSEEEYRRLASTTMAKHDDKVKQIRDKGQTGKLMFLVGQMMRAGDEGRVEAKKAETVLRRMILGKGEREEIETEKEKENRHIR